MGRHTAILALAVALAGPAARPGPAPPPAQWSRIRCPAADRQPAERFQALHVIEDFEKGRTAWTAAEGEQQAQATLSLDRRETHRGAAALRVDYQFAGKSGYEYVEVVVGAPIEQPGLGVGLWVKGAGAPLPLRIRVKDRTGETHQVDLARLGFPGWRFVAARLDQDGGWWGGDGNRRLDTPCTLHSIVADRPERGYRGKGALWLDDVQLVRPRKMEEAMRIEALGQRLGNIYEPGDTVQLRASGPGEGIAWRVEDTWGRRVAEGRGPAEGAAIAFRLERAGWFACTVERRADGAVAESRVFRCAALPPADPTRRNGFVGVGCHFRGLQYPLECMDLLVRLGITQFRDEVSWSAVERKKGELALPDWGEAFATRAAELGLEPLLIFDYGNRLYDEGGFPISEEAVAAYARYAAFLARRLKGRVDTFEVWNEYSIGCGMRGKPQVQTPQTYARMLQATYRAVKAAAPEATVVGVGGEHSKHHLEFIRGMLAAGAAKALDAVSVHSYRYPASPEETDLVGEVRHVAELARGMGAPARLWVTEIGWPTHLGPRGVDERAQARLLVRTLALLQGSGVVEKAYWYDFKNDGLKRDYNEHNFGVVWHERFGLAPKPAAVALSVFARMTAGATVQRLWREDDAIAVLYRRPDGTDLAVAWCPGGERRLAVRARGLKATDLMGNASRPGPPVALSPDPVYLSGRGLQWDVAPR